MRTGEHVLDNDETGIPVRGMLLAQELQIRDMNERQHCGHTLPVDHDIPLKTA